MVPWQGPFRVSLNAEESTVHIFWPVYEKLYKAVFGRLAKYVHYVFYKKIEINCICCSLPGFFAGCHAHVLLHVSFLRLLMLSYPNS